MRSFHKQASKHPKWVSSEHTKLRVFPPTVQGSQVLEESPQPYESLAVAGQFLSARPISISLGVVFCGEGEKEKEAAGYVIPNQLATWKIIAVGT